jgi:hypothetical protein
VRLALVVFMSRLHLPLLICLSASALVAWWGWPRASARYARVADATRRSAPAEKTLGVASCASMACHNGNGPRGSKGSEYSTWVAVDPHAKAYRALAKPESKRMQENLTRHADEEAKKRYGRSASENPLCLKCHGMGDGVAQDLQTDGVGCERCHGPAEHWKTTHYLDGFDRKTPGFVDTRDLETRARTCVKCHVGDADQEVNHDLIAAGHPRLRFEFGAYHANYPKHWSEARDKADKGFEARAWVVGQLVSAQAALELLASRAEGKDSITKEKKPWPEFAEYECAACHHGLEYDSDRQKRYAREAPKPGEKRGRPRAGALPWGTWYYKLFPTVGRTMPAGRTKKLETRLKGLEQLMQKRLPSSDPVASEARDAAGLIKGWLDKAKANRLNANQVRRLLEDLAGRKDVVGSGWDGGTQVYLGLAAMHHALCDLDPTFQARSPLRGPLLEMRKDLLKAFDKGARPLYDSPRYAPGKMQRDLAVIEKLVK